MTINGYQPLAVVEDFIKAFGRNKQAERELFEQLCLLFSQDDTEARLCLERLSLCLDKAAIPVISHLQKYMGSIPTPQQFPVVEKYVYRGTQDGFHDVFQKGFVATGDDSHVVRHKSETGSSIYISASKQLQIAVEHAQASTQGLIVCLRSEHAVDCKKWYAPVSESLAMEEEVFYVRQVPVSEIVGVSWLSRPDTFYDQNKRLITL